MANTSRCVQVAIHAVSRAARGLKRPAALTVVGSLMAFAALAVHTSAAHSSAVQPQSSSSAVSCPASAGVPCYDHIFTILMENHSYTQVITAPYISSLAAKGAVAGNYFATDHPSLPNYAELTSGQTFPNASTDCSPSPSCQSTAANITDLLNSRGLTWHAGLMMTLVGAVLASGLGGSLFVAWRRWRLGA